MLHARISCNDMGNDPGCLRPRHKKSKIVEPEHYTGKWEVLPTVILHEIYSLLPAKDRINASSTCRTWRQCLYHPKFWKEVTFKIYPDNLKKARYLTTAVGHIVTHAVIQVNSLSVACMNEFMLLLQQLKCNDNLLSLILEPAFSHMEMPMQYLDAKDKMMPVVQHIMNICTRRPLQRFSLGMNEELLQHTPLYLGLLAKNRPEMVTTLGLALLRDDPAIHYILHCDSMLLLPFTNLQILSTNYDTLTDTFLHSLRVAKKLRRLVIHLHGMWEPHGGTTEEAWRLFSESHPDCGVRLSLIHAYNEVLHPYPPFLRQHMKLTHFRALFCENMNRLLLDLLARYYKKTLRSFMWIDSVNNEKIMWNMTDPLRQNLFPNDPDPLVILAWLCSNLEEITLIGYKYTEEDLVAIARLRTDTLKKFEVANTDIIYSRARNINARKEISSILGKQWQPIPNSQLHPVILNPVEGDSDEFISPYLLSDIQ